MSNVFRKPGLQAGREVQVPIRLREVHKPLPPIEGEQKEWSYEELMAERAALERSAAEEASAERQRLQTDRELFERQRIEERQRLEEARAGAERSGYEEGFQQGFEEGRRKSESEMAASVAEANELVESAQRMADQYLQKQERVIVELALQAAQRILAQQLEENSDRFLSVVQRGLKEAREMQDVKLFVSKRYYPLLAEHYDELASIFPVGVPLMVFVDEELGDTDCYIEASHGRIVISIDEQLQQLREQLNALLDRVE